MKKSSLIIGGEMLPIIGSKPRLSEIYGVQPVGSQVLVELLTAEELYNTVLSLGTQKVKDGFQGFVRAVGPSVKTEEWGFRIGDRVLVSGGGVPVPNYDNIERERVLMEPHSIKGVLVSEE